MASIGVATPKRIIEIYNMMMDGTLCLKPQFQRNLVWNDRHKESFLETIILGLPFPEVYFAQGEIDLLQTKAITLVVDGQQRLTTIREYVSDDPSLKLSKVTRYPDLTEQLKQDFLNYVVVVRDLGQVSEATIKEIFRRINSVQYALNAMEINHALYQGEFISTAQDIVNANVLKQLDIFDENQNNRMRDVEFILLVMTTVEAGGYFAQDREVGEYIKQYDNEYEGRQAMTDDIAAALKSVARLHLPLDSLWLRKSSFFTLVVELVCFKRRCRVFPETAKLRKILQSLETRIEENKASDITKNEFARFYTFVFQATTSKRGRVARGTLLQSWLKGLEPAPETLVAVDVVKD